MAPSAQGPGEPALPRASTCSVKVLPGPSISLSGARSANLQEGAGAPSFQQRGPHPKVPTALAPAPPQAQGRGGRPQPAFVSPSSGAHRPVRSAVARSPAASLGGCVTPPPTAEWTTRLSENHQVLCSKLCSPSFELCSPSLASPHQGGHERNATHMEQVATALLYSSPAGSGCADSSGLLGVGSTLFSEGQARGHGQRKHHRVW